MLPGYSALAQALQGTFFTWAVTALGAALVYLFPTSMSHALQRQILDGALGFASGVMLAASFWSLLAPALDAAGAQWGDAFAFVPVSAGFLAGGGFLVLTEFRLPSDSVEQLAVSVDGGASRSTRVGKKAKQRESVVTAKRIMMLVLAVTIHNFPEGMAVGVGFASAASAASAAASGADSDSSSSSSSPSFAKAVALTIGIGLQNFPEGLAVSLPLLRLGFSKHRAFFYGQLSGMVEPLGGLLGAGAIIVAEPLLPYALAFAAGAMVYVVCDDLVPEAHKLNPKTASIGTMVGFVVMMSMDTALG
jgi:zinc transporter ZupT